MALCVAGSGWGKIIRCLCYWMMRYIIKSDAWACFSSAVASPWLMDVMH
uniref:Uncharacterized protein n=1 Tax=Arundo donax TaxID=35708 RepID=A0A0A8Z289_ARUDO